MGVNRNQLVDVDNVQANTRCKLEVIGLIISFDTTVSVLMFVRKNYFNCLGDCHGISEGDSVNGFRTTTSILSTEIGDRFCEPVY